MNCPENLGEGQAVSQLFGTTGVLMSLFLHSPLPDPKRDSRQAPQQENPRLTSGRYLVFPVTIRSSKFTTIT